MGNIGSTISTLPNTDGQLDLYIVAKASTVVLRKVLVRKLKGKRAWSDAQMAKTMAYLHTLTADRPHASSARSRVC